MLTARPTRPLATPSGWYSEGSPIAEIVQLNAPALQVLQAPRDGARAGAGNELKLKSLLGKRFQHAQMRDAVNLAPA